MPLAGPVTYTCDPLSERINARHAGPQSLSANRVRLRPQHPRCSLSLARARSYCATCCILNDIARSRTLYRISILGLNQSFLPFPAILKFGSLRRLACSNRAPVEDLIPPPDPPQTAHQSRKEIPRSFVDKREPKIHASPRSTASVMA